MAAVVTIGVRLVGSSRVSVLQLAHEASAEIPSGAGTSWSSEAATGAPKKRCAPTWAPTGSRFQMPIWPPENRAKARRPLVLIVSDATVPVVVGGAGGAMTVSEVRLKKVTPLAFPMTA